VKAAIVILNWNGKHLMEEFLPKVIAHAEGLATVYVADNASTDDSVAYVEQHFPEVRLVLNKQNHGYAGGYNQALLEIDADLYILMNSDIETTTGWLLPILSRFEQNKKTAIIQPKILDYKKRDSFEYAGAAGGFIDRLGYPYCRGRIFNALEKDLGQYDGDQEIFWASGACLCIRGEVFWKLKGFDEDFFAHQEEIDLCWRAQKFGYKVEYVGTSAVFHVGGATLNNMNPAKTFLNFRNTLFALTKNAPKRYLPWLVIARLVLDGVAGIKFLLEGKAIHTWAIVRAHGSYYRKAYKMFKKRSDTPTLKKYYTTQSVVWNHFVLQKMIFGEL